MFLKLKTRVKYFFVKSNTTFYYVKDYTAFILHNDKVSFVFIFFYHFLVFIQGWVSVRVKIGHASMFEHIQSIIGYFQE